MIKFTCEKRKYAKYKIGRFTYGEPQVYDWTGISKLCIGDYCSISTGVKIFLDGNHEKSYLTTYPVDLLLKKNQVLASNIRSKGDVLIGNDVWIGMDATIMSGVIIGDGAIIGAGAVVVKDVPSGEVWGGNPAKKISDRFSCNELRRYQTLKPWLFEPEDLCVAQELDLLIAKPAPFSICMVIYHEENRIENCLNIISQISDDIVIIHDGECQDRTAKICEKYPNVRFFEAARKGIAEGHRIDSFRKARHDWILCLDADEQIDQRTALVLNLLAGVDYYHLVDFVWPLSDGTKAIASDYPRKAAFFKFSKLKYLDFPQSSFETNGKLFKSRLILQHLPAYNNFTLKSFMVKWRSWAKVQARATLLDFSDFQKIGYDGQFDWSSGFKLKRRFSLLFPLIAIREFIVNMPRLSSLSCVVLKAHIMWCFYVAMVYYYVEVLKWTKKY